MGSVPRKCWRDYIYSIWHRNALQSHRRRDKMWLEESTCVGYFAGRRTQINSRKWMDRFSFLHFGLSSISNPKLKGLKMFSLQIFDPVWVERTWPFVVSSRSKINIRYRFYVWDSIVLRQYDEGFSSSLFYFSFLALTLIVEVFSASSYP